jgi:hypothetical protein
VRTLYVKKPLRTDSPPDFAFNYSEVAHETEKITCTPVCCLLGQAGALPYFLSERYINHQAIRRFLSIFHTRLVEVWFQIHSYKKFAQNIASIDRYGLIVEIQTWYKKKYHGHLHVEILSLRSLYHSNNLALDQMHIGQSIGMSLCKSVTIVIDDFSVVNAVEVIARRYCNLHVHIVCKETKQINSVRLA